MITWMEVSPSPIALRDLLKAHRLFPDLLEDPIALIRYANLTRVGYLGADDAPVLVLLESPLEAGSVLVQVVLKDKEFHTNPEVLDLAKELGERWFQVERLRRVEARVDCSRTPTIKFLKALGFHQETGPSGIRQAYLQGGEPVSLHILGLLPEDKPRLRLNRPKLDATIKDVEVPHGI